MSIPPEPFLPSESCANRVNLRVRGTDGKERILDISAATEAEAIRKAAARGFQVLAIEQGIAAVAADKNRRFPLSLFSQELLTLLEAGLNLTEALATLAAKEKQASTRAVLQGLLQSLQEGKNFSDVLASMPDLFSEVYVATVRASERTGTLPKALARYIAYQMQFDALRKKIITAAIYPIMLLAVGGFVTLFLLGYVVPRFSAVYESSGREVPWMSSMLLGFGQIIHHHWQFALVGVIAVIAMVGYGIGRPAGRRFITTEFLRLPWFAVKADEFRLARFYRALSLLLASGIALPRAMGMVAGLLSPAQQPGLLAARQAVEQGQRLSVALIAAGLASPVAESLIKVGERSGQLGAMLEHTARFHDEDLARWIDWASRLLEPMLMTIIGLVIGTVVVLMYMPIFELAGSLQ